MTDSFSPSDIDWLAQWARLSPTALAVKDADGGESYTYLELFQLSCEIAEEFDRRGLKKGDRVGMLATNEIEAVVLFFACLRMGYILVPINFRLTAREITHILDDSDPVLLIYQRAFDTTLSAIQNLSSKTMVFESFKDLVAEKLSALRKFPTIKDKKQPIRNTANDPCMILYTSGTTGAPKGAIVTPKMLHWNSLNTTLRLNLSKDDVFVSFLPFFHTGGWNVLLTPFIHHGAKIVLTKKFDADRVLSLCESEGATIMFGVPTTMDMMARSPLFPTVDLSRVRYAIVGGEPMPIELIRTWQIKNIPVRQGFGLTEFGPNVFSLNEEDSVRKIGSIGFPNFYVEARIIDREGRDVPRGEIGELILRGPVCTPGYWRNEKATNEAIVDGWFHTGDLVRSDEEGYYYVAGRKKDMYVSGGENVYPVEVENVLSQHPSVREVAVVGVPDPKWGEVGRAYVSLSDVEPNDSETENERIARLKAELVQFCADKLAKFKIPEDVQVMSTLPKGYSGKILKRELRTPMALLFFIFLVGLAGCQSSRHKDFEKIQSGMSKADVLDIMGGPREKMRWKGRDRWAYTLFGHPEGDVVREVHFENGKATYIGPAIKPKVSAADQDRINDMENAAADARAGEHTGDDSGLQIQKFKSIENEESSSSQ